jgi:hypothetical protein
MTGKQRDCCNAHYVYLEVFRLISAAPHSPDEGKGPPLLADVLNRPACVRAPNSAPRPERGQRVNSFIRVRATSIPLKK